MYNNAITRDRPIPTSHTREILDTGNQKHTSIILRLKQYDRY